MRYLPTVLLTFLLVPTASNAVRMETRMLPMRFANGISIAAVRGTVSPIAVKQAMRAWNQGLKVEIFRQAAVGEKPDVTVSGAANVPSREDLQGSIDMDTSSESISAAVQIALTNDGKRLSDVQVGAVLTHELGHVLGLDDAPDGTPAGQYVMGVFDPQKIVKSPSPSEIRAVRKLLPGLNIAK